MSIGKPFEPGREKTGGRARGTRNKISEAFLRDLHDEWERSGQAALKVMAVEDPSNFVKVTAALLPRELEINETHLMQIDDSDLDAYIEFIKRTIAQRTLSIGVRTDETAH